MSFKRTQSLGQLLCRHTESLPPRRNEVRDLEPDIGLQTWHTDCIKSHSESGQTGAQTLLSPSLTWSLCSQSDFSREDSPQEEALCRKLQPTCRAWNTRNFPSGCVPEGHHRRRNSTQQGAAQRAGDLGQRLRGFGNSKASGAPTPEHPATWQLWATSPAPRPSRPPFGSQRS